MSRKSNRIVIRRHAKSLGEVLTDEARRRSLMFRPPELPSTRKLKAAAAKKAAEAEMAKARANWDKFGHRVLAKTTEEVEALDGLMMLDGKSKPMNEAAWKNYHELKPLYDQQEIFEIVFALTPEKKAVLDAKLMDRVLTDNDPRLPMLAAASTAYDARLRATNLSNSAANGDVAAPPRDCCVKFLNDWWAAVQKARADNGLAPLKGEASDYFKNPYLYCCYPSLD